jgi:hypothetical protein
VLIGLLSPFTRVATEPWHQAFREGMRELGWVEGENVSFEYRYADGHNQRLPGLVGELIGLNPRVIVVSVNTDALPAAKATKTIPIVMAAPGDPVATGLIASLAHPGGNLTGLTQMATDLAGKRLQLLKDMAPGISRVAVLRDPQGGSVSSLAWREIQEPARQLGIELHSLEVESPEQVDAALTSALGAHADALTALTRPRIRGQRKADRRFRLGESSADGVSPARIRARRRLAVLRAGSRRSVPPRRELCRQDPQRRQAGRPACPAAHEVRAGDQSENREDARPHRAASAARQRRRGRRMRQSAVLVRVLMLELFRS